MAKVANATTVIELFGIRMAASIDDRFPVKAIDKSIRLYRNEIPKLISYLEKFQIIILEEKLVHSSDNDCLIPVYVNNIVKGSFTMKALYLL